mgnify:CR=1 FL=1|tara:strand:- start:15 stop:284 length:270 start_codon:yes stop_codon:yes gene_type:complete
MILEIILAIFLITSLYVNWNLLRKIETIEEANEEYSEWILQLDSRLKDILSTIKTIDSKNLFESDDEVGSVYDKISETIKKLKEFSNEA